MKVIINIVLVTNICCSIADVFVSINHILRYHPGPIKDAWKAQLVPGTVGCAVTVSFK